MSPSTLRRYRAERLLRQEFGGLRDEVLGSVQGRLRARGVQLDRGDLEGCYAQAWQGLYTAIAAGEEIANPGGWLAVVTFRRAIDEHRSARVRGFGCPTHPERVAVGPGEVESAPVEPDLAAKLDDRTRLRHLFEALRVRLNARECEAAALCYLQGLTRAQAAERMGISEARMVKLMEGRGPGRPGVAGKVGELLEAIRSGEWCEQQASLMRGLAFGILDPRGERYRLARLHQRECPACRAYVLSLRGLAAVLPPLPLPWALGLEAPPTPASSAHGIPSTHGVPSTHRVPPSHAPAHAAGAKAAGASGSAGAGAGAISASGAVGAGSAAGGGWLLGGSLGAKLAVSCVLALSVGCVALTVVPHHSGASPHRRRPVRAALSASAYIADAPATVTGSTPLGGVISGRSSATAVTPMSPAARAAAAHRAAARRAQREFGPEQAAAGAASVGSSTPPAVATASAASVHHLVSPASSTITPTSTGSGPPTRAEREFGPE